MKINNINLLIAFFILFTLSKGISQSSKKYGKINLNHTKTLYPISDNDTNNLPKISINSLNGYGPYTIGTKRSNYFMVYDLPVHTSEITFKMLDAENQIINSPYTAEGNYLESSYWEFESDTMGFPLSPTLQIEVVYQGDSNAVYRIPYVVYPDTLFIQASAGWGPFVTNNYNFSDDNWQSAPNIKNTFKVKNLPPRTYQVKFSILSNDTTVIDSNIVNAEEGLYLDSAMYNNVRMDQLPLSTRFLETSIFCDGGPDEGILRWNKLTILPQRPKLVCSTYEGIFNDSLPNFIQDQNTGQILNVDSSKYAVVSNGPGELNLGVYHGPYSLDVLNGAFTIEAWLRFDNEEISSHPNGEFYILNVDTAFAASILVDYNAENIGLRLYIGIKGYFDNLYEGDIPLANIKQAEWHHIAITFEPYNGKHPHFYIDGKSMEVNVDHDQVIYYEENYPDYQDLLKSNPMQIGGDAIMNNFITAIDELRIWNTSLSHSMIKENMYKSMLQNDSIVGYWNFDDLRNRQNFVSDLSYKNNSGVLKKNAYFSPQPDDVGRFKDELTITSSHADIDSIRFSFIDDHNGIQFTKNIIPEENTASLIYDISNQTYKTKYLRVNEFYPGSPDTGFISNYKFTIFPPSPMATPRYNWCEVYQSDSDSDILNTDIICSNFPDRVTNVSLYLKKDGELYDSVNYTKNTIPYAYSLKLNGIDNYIETSKLLTAPTVGIIEFWFKTSTQLGGKMVGFSTTKNGENSSRNEREITMLKSGVIELKVDDDISLYANHPYNDGQWHHLTAKYGYPSTELHIDGSLVDYKYSPELDSYSGYWIIGKNTSSKFSEKKSVSTFFKGSFSDINIYRLNNQTNEIHYKLNDALGNEVDDHGGNNDGTIIGSAPKWSNTLNKLSFVNWEANLLNKEPGNYTFTAKVLYDGGPANGVEYKLGRFHIKNPIYNSYFSYAPEQGIGYFNEGMKLENRFRAATDWTGSGFDDYESDFISMVFVTLDHEIIDKKTETFNGEQLLSFTFDMGDAPKGSYMSIEIGYVTYNGNIVMHSFPVAININKMVPPAITGDFDGPFEESIAPGTMVQENTFTITTVSHLDDLSKIKGVFYTDDKIEIGTSDAEKINDTTWHLTYDMANLKPPHSLMRVEYYLGDDEEPVIIQGPFSITIHRTRPRWFDFMKDSDFKDIKENGDTVTFSVSTYLSKNNEVVENNFYIPAVVPVLGGTNFESPTPSITAKLKFKKSENLLILDGPPQFQRDLFNFDLGNPGLIRLDLQNSEQDYYYLDDNNDLRATQNFANSDDVTLSIKRIVENPLKELSKLAEGYQASEIIGPTANLTISPAIGYASRLNYITDTVNGGWGSFGDLNVDANPNHGEAHNKSASYHFGFMGMSGELSVGATIAAGLIDFYIGLSIGCYVGMGYSYKDLPENAKKFIGGAVIQSYWRVYATALWDWYEVNLYGPKPLFRWHVGNDMKPVFPPYDGNKTKLAVRDSDFDISMTQIHPVGWFHKIPLPQPNQQINIFGKSLNFSWINPGQHYGERKLQLRSLNISKAEFDSTKTITFNKNLINKPSSAQVNEKDIIFTWMQTRHNPESIKETNPEFILENIAKSQDIFVAIYNQDADSVVFITNIQDDTSTLHSGRAEANPHITRIADNKALIIWHVGNLVTYKSDLYYSIVEKIQGEWTITNPQVFAEPTGIQTNVRIASPEENKAVAIWQNSLNNGKIDNEMYTSIFDGYQWSDAVSLFPVDTSIFYKSYDLCFENSRGAIVFNTYSNDINTDYLESLYILPWESSNSRWSSEPPISLYSDTLREISISKLSINEEGNAAIAIKLGKPGSQSADIRFSQVDLFTADISASFDYWTHIEANKFVCDTTKQISDIDIAYAGGDTVVLLTHEYIMVASNMEYVPTNGARFGDPKMNLVLRSFILNDDGQIEDINEGSLLDIKEREPSTSDFVLEQNFPNPCSYNTTVKFYLPHGTKASLSIYDVNGFAGTVFEKNLSAGEYEVNINTSLFKGGVYFYKLKTENGIKTKKMLVVH